MKKPQKRHKLLFQMAALLVSLSLLPLATTSYFNFRYAAKALQEDKLNNLEAIAHRQSSEIRTYLDNMKGIAQLISESDPVVQILTEGKQYESTIKQLVSGFGFNALYLVTPEGVLIQSSEKEKSTPINLLKNEQKYPELVDVYKRVKLSLSPQISNFSSQTITGIPSLYIAVPVTKKGQFIGSVLLALNVNDIYTIAGNEVGLGVTGETIIVRQNKENFIFLNNTRHAPNAAFTTQTPIRRTDDTPYDFGNEEEQKNDLAIDYRNKEVLAAWAPLSGMEGTIIVKIDRAEVFNAITRLRDFSLIVGSCTLALVLLLSTLIAGNLTRPIVALTEIASRIAKGDLTPKVNVYSKNEIGLLARAVGTMSDTLKSLVSKVQGSAHEMSDTAMEIVAYSRQQAQSAQQTGSASLQISATAKEIFTTARELTLTMTEVNEVAQQTAIQAESGLDGIHSMSTTMKEVAQTKGVVSNQLSLIEQKAEAIAEVIVTMTKVADQTNLLSLNATIEARQAHATNHGRGFAIVALEIQRLADQTAVSTLDIEHSIQSMLSAVRTGVKGMECFSSQLDTAITEITTVGASLGNIIQQVQGLPPRFEMILEGMQSQAECAGQINESIASLNESAHKTITTLKKTQHTIEKLKNVSETLQKEISQFNV